MQRLEGALGRALRAGAAAACVIAWAAVAGAQATPPSYDDFDLSIRSGDGRAFQAAILRGAYDAIYLPRGGYVIDNPIVIDRARPLTIHGADRVWTALIAANPGRPLFIVRNVPKLNLAGLNLFPTARQTEALNAVVIATANTQPVNIEIQDCNVDRGRLEFTGPGTYRIQSSVLTPGGRTRGAILVDHPQADLLLFGGDITNASERLRTDSYAHVWQKHGRVRLYSTTLEATLGDADIRIETASALGPHILANLRSEGANGSLNRKAVSRLLLVPPTTERVDVLLKSNGGAWDTGPEAQGEARMNCKLVSYNAKGTLWLIGNRAEGLCGRSLVEGSAPGATIVSVGNLISSPQAFTVTGARVITAGDMFNNYMWTRSETFPWMRWIGDGKPLSSFKDVPPLPEDLLPPALQRPVMTTVLPGMRDARAYGAVGDGVTDDTAALQRALDADCEPRISKVLFIPAGTYKIRDTLYLRHHAGGSCRVTTTLGGWIVGAGSGRTILQMDPAVKKGVFATDGLIFATVQGITFKTFPWKAGEPQEPNFDLEFYPKYVATQLNNLYDVVFDGGFAGFAAGVKTPTAGQCSSNMVFGGRMTNTHIGFVSGHYNSIANGVADSEFVDNDVALGSWTNDEKNMPPGGTFFAYRSKSRGTRERDLLLRGTSNGNTFYAYEWDSDAPSYFQSGAGAAPWPLLFERSKLLPRAAAPGPVVPLFDTGTSQGPIFLFSKVGRGLIKVGQTGSGQGYAIKLNSDVADWGSSVAPAPHGQLHEATWMGPPGTPTPVGD